MVLDILNMFMIMAAGLAILLGIHLLSTKEKRLPNILLGIMMFFFALNLLDVFLITSGYCLKYPHLIAFSAVFPYVYGPMLYLFARSVSENSKKLTITGYLHLFPFIILTVIGFPLYFLKDDEYKIGMLSHSVDAPVLEFLGMMIPVVGIIYVLLSARIYNNYRKKIKQNYSNIDQINLEWLKYYILGNGFVWMFVVVSYIVQPFMPDWFIPNFLIYIPLSGFIWWISYISLAKQSSYLINSADVTKITPPAYSKSGLTGEQAAKIIAGLELLIKEKEPYRDSSLKLQDLSQALEVPPHYLTEILNTKLKQNFYDFINAYRVEEVKRLIEKDRNKKYNLLTLALQAGFSSKSSFNSIFKRHTGETPSEYRIKVLNKKAA